MPAAGLPVALTVAAVVSALALAVVAAVAVTSLVVLVRLARRLAETEAALRRLLETAQRETAATMVAVRGAAGRVEDLAGFARRLSRGVPLALALGWLGLGRRGRGLAATLAALAGALEAVGPLLGRRGGPARRRPLRPLRRLLRRSPPSSPPPCPGA